MTDFLSGKTYFNVIPMDNDPYLGSHTANNSYLANNSFNVNVNITFLVQICAWLSRVFA